MKNRLLLIVSLFFTLSSNAQRELPSFPGFEIGLKTGVSLLGQDVFGKISPNVGVFAIQPAGNAFALRYNLSAYQLKGINHYTTQTEIANNRTVYDLGYTSFVNNYSTRLYDLSIEALYVMRSAKIDGYIGLGPSCHVYNVRYNATDVSGNLYDFSPLLASITARGDISKEDIEIVNTIFDGTYETNQLIYKDFDANSSIGASVRGGITYAINPSFKIGLDARWLLSLQDNLDGFRNPSNNIFNNDQVLSLSITGSYSLQNSNF